MSTIAHTSIHTVALQGDPGLFSASLETVSDTDGVALVRLVLTAEIPQVPPPIALAFAHPDIDIQAEWTTGSDWRRGLSVDWGRGFVSKATSQAPVLSLMNDNGQNRLTVAFADALNPIRINAGLHEETAQFRCSIHLFEEPGPAIVRYESVVLLDTRDQPYYQSLDDVQRWWSELPGYEPSPVPDTARRPMYSTWYSFHQQLTPNGIEAQCQIARELGCEAVIVDDGWQTADNNRGYAYCGDWEVSQERIPDMRAHVARVHDIGLKYLLWYSVPFVGRYSKAWERFAGKFLTTGNPRNFETLDPRFPEVREYLIDTYERAMLDWDLDGFKLDFVDNFHLPKEKHGELGNGRDYDSVPEATYRLLSDVIVRLRAIKPEVMIEFRQSYIGPLMRKFGNMFRAGDCPNDAITNRIRTIDIRLLSGNTAVHADMMMWNGEEPVETAALQIINTLFSVPQISVLLDMLPPAHLNMVRFWLGWWNEHRATLLDGNLQPLFPAQHYPIVVSSTSTESVIAVYSDVVIPVYAKSPSDIWVVNGTHNNRLVFEFVEDIGERQTTVFNCVGQKVIEAERGWQAGLQSVNVPPSGLIHIAARAKPQPLTL